MRGFGPQHGDNSFGVSRRPEGLISRRSGMYGIRNINGWRGGGRGGSRPAGQCRDRIQLTKYIMKEAEDQPSA